MGRVWTNWDGGFKSRPGQGLYVCFLLCYVVLVRLGLAISRLSIQGVLPMSKQLFQGLILYSKEEIQNKFRIFSLGI